MPLTVVEPTGCGIGSNAFAIVWDGASLYGLELLGAVDLLLVSAQGHAAPTFANMATFGHDAAMMDNLLTFTCTFNLTGHPTITLFGSFTGQGMPLPFQLVAGHRAEALLCRAGHAFQGVTDHHLRHPALTA